MADDAGAVADDVGAASPTPPRTKRSSSRRTDWRLGGRTVARWRERPLAVSVIALGAALLGGGAASLLLPPALSGWVSLGLLWAAMAGAVIYAFARSRPVGLLRFGPTDLLWGIGLGLLLRICQGWIDIATGGSGALPSYPQIGGSLSDTWLFAEVVAPVVVAPVLEELFFRGVILVSLYTIFRRPFGYFAASVAAALISTALFVVAHSLSGMLDVGAILSLALLGAVCSALVLLTGRIWSAVLVHAFYNATYVGLALAGTYLG